MFKIMCLLATTLLALSASADTNKFALDRDHKTIFLEHSRIPLNARLGPFAFELLRFLTEHPGQRFTVQELSLSVPFESDRPQGRRDLVRVRRCLGEITEAIEGLAPGDKSLFRGHRFVVWMPTSLPPEQTVTLVLRNGSTFTITKGAVRWKNLPAVRIQPAQETILRELITSPEQTLSHPQIAALFPSRKELTPAQIEVRSHSVISMIRKRIKTVAPDFPGLRLDRDNVYLFANGEANDARLEWSDLNDEEAESPNVAPSCGQLLEYSNEQLIAILRARGLNVQILEN